MASQLVPKWGLHPYVLHADPKLGLLIGVKCHRGFILIFYVTGEFLQKKKKNTNFT